jgi:RimJ/RimL family protein N-acetyltransferase
MASVGILIAEKEMRNKGYAKEAILQLHQIASKQLGVKYLEAKIQISNTNSIGFFEGIGYTKVDQEEGVSEANIYQFIL